MKKGIKNIVLFTVGISIGVLANVLFSVYKKSKNTQVDRASKYWEMFTTLEKWMMDKQEGKQIKDYIDRQGYKTVAIYGINHLGNLLKKELEAEEVKISFAIDKNADNLYSEIKVIKPGEKIPDIDVIIVTAVSYFEEIKKELEGKCSCDIISLEEIVYSLN